MEINDNKFRLEDLYIGMEIKNKNQLDVYTVRFIDKETNAE